MVAVLKKIVGWLEIVFVINVVVAMGIIEYGQIEGEFVMDSFSAF